MSHPRSRRGCQQKCHHFPLPAQHRGCLRLLISLYQSMKTDSPSRASTGRCFMADAAATAVSGISLHLPAWSDLSLRCPVIKRKLISPGTDVSKLSDSCSVMTVNQLDLTLIAYLKHWAPDRPGDGWSCQRRSVWRGEEHLLNHELHKSKG